MAKQTTLTDLPPELLDHITTYLPAAQSIASLSSTSKNLHAFAEKDAWQTFTRTRFPSLCPQSQTHKDVARTLTSLSRAWDRRAFVSRYIEPQGDIHAFPGDKRIDRWKRPRGQTIGFTPQLDCYEEIGSTWRDRKEMLAFSAGAEVCVRERRRGSSAGQDSENGDRGVRWTTYRPLDASEGRDDITSMHLMRPQEGDTDRQGVQLISGTANGDLRLIELSGEGDTEISTTSFTTQGLAVRSSSLLQEQWKPPTLAANLGDRRICLYPVDPTQTSITPSSQIDIQSPANGHRSYRAWSTNFLSDQHLAVGLGPSQEPIHIYSVTPSGIDKEALRKFSLQNDIDQLEGEITLSGFAKKTTSSVYPIVPLSPVSTAGGGSTDGQVFLSGAYDGNIRLHDLRSKREVEYAYIDPTDEGAIYSLLPRGRETLVAGTSRHSLLKVFDMRLGAKAYSYLDARNTGAPFEEWQHQRSQRHTDWNLFLKPHSATYPGRGGGNNWARRSAESSIYSLTSPSPHSPYLYAGVENAVVEMAFTSILDKQDPTFFSPDHPRHNNEKARRGSVNGGDVFKTKEILDLAMYEQHAPDMRLMTQRSLWETFRVRKGAGDVVMRQKTEFLNGLDERWKVGSS